VHLGKLFPSSLSSPGCFCTNFGENLYYAVHE